MVGELRSQGEKHQPIQKRMDERRLGTGKTEPHEKEMIKVTKGIKNVAEVWGNQGHRGKEVTTIKGDKCGRVLGKTKLYGERRN